MRSLVVPALLSACLLAFSVPSARGDSTVDFGREILPLLSDHCFQCHGPDEKNREAGLRLDQQDAVLAELDSGERAVVAGNSGESELFQRLVSDDPDLQMPPADSGKRLTPQQIDRIRRWIDGGAEWATHWAYEKPVKPSLPDRVSEWTEHNPIDRFIHARLAEHELEPESRADNETLIRRVTLDLTGLPPTIAEIDAFLADESPEAFERVVDRLLDSSAYGEQMARIWLDAARYADTHGLHLDNERSIWLYRNWVIDAFNQNKPFDQFTVEQLAGDLLPEATLSQRVATGFNRCNVTTGEGGSIDDEYYVRYAVDRVETTSTVFLGLTAGCAACHDHKFDPLTQKEFYQLFSYFFSLTEKAMDGNVLLPPPSIKVPSDEQNQQKTAYQTRLSELDEQIEAALSAIAYEDPAADETLGELPRTETVWIDDALPAGAKPEGDGPEPWKFVGGPEHPVLSGEKSTVRTGTGLTQHFFSRADAKFGVGAPGKLFAYVYLDPQNPPETIQLQFNDGNWNHRAYWGADKAHGAGQKGPANHHMGDLPELGKWVRLEVDATTVGLKPESQLNGWAFTQYGGTVHWDKAGVVAIAPPEDDKLVSMNLWEQAQQQVKTPGIPAEIQKLLDIEKSKRSDAQQRQLTRYFLQHVNPQTRVRFAEPMKQRADTRRQLDALEKAIPATLVMEERKQPRQAYVLERGEYTEKRDPVSSAVPTWIAPLPQGAPANRLGLARWLVSPENPLTARVTVNRYWQHFFGIGLVRTSEDFGIQGEQPSHPQLLDWLSQQFIEGGWDVKQMHKLMVMSATYQQSSHVEPSKLAVDPENRLLARGPRFRLDAEVIRDSALAVSGLLVRTVGGKSVRPYQPAGLWKPVGFGGSNTSVFKQDHGDKLYRRSMYTFWKRTSPPPSMATFDAPDRETCQVRRARTNTPLQSLVLLNDVQFFEAARKFAERVMRRDDRFDDRLTFAVRSVLSRHPRPAEVQSLTALFQACRSEFANNPDAADKLLSTGEAPRAENLDRSELAAWTMVTHLLLNLSETVTKG